MARPRDIVTADLFSLPAPAPVAPGSLACRVEISSTMSQALKRCAEDRFAVAATMSRLLGDEVSIHMLNAYTSESRDTHIPSLDRAIAFDVATGQQSLLRLFAAKSGATINVGEEALHAELGRLMKQQQEIAAQAKALKGYLGRPK